MGHSHVAVALRTMGTNSVIGVCIDSNPTRHPEILGGKLGLSFCSQAKGALGGFLDFEIAAPFKSAEIRSREQIGTTRFVVAGWWQRKTSKKLGDVLGRVAFLGWCLEESTRLLIDPSVWVQACEL